MEKSKFLGGGGGGVHEKPICRGDCLKRDGWTWTVRRFKGGGLGKKEGVVFLRGVWGEGWYPNAHYDNLIIRVRWNTVWRKNMWVDAFVFVSLHITLIKFSAIFLVQLLGRFVCHIYEDIQQTLQGNSLTLALWKNPTNVNIAD